MVLDHVAHGSTFLVITAPTLDADGFGGCDLNLVYVAPVPERLENTVAEPEGQNVLHRLLAQVVVDPVDLVFREHGLQACAELAGARKIVAEGLLHDDPPPTAGRLRRPRPVRQARR